MNHRSCDYAKRFNQQARGRFCAWKEKMRNALSFQAPEKHTLVASYFAVPEIHHGLVKAGRMRHELVLEKPDLRLFCKQNRHFRCYYTWRNAECHVPATKYQLIRKKNQKMCEHACSISENFAISSSGMHQPNRSMFSLVHASLSLFGSTLCPIWMPQRRATWAGVFCSLLAMEMTVGWLRTFGPSFPGDPGEPSGAYACKNTPIQNQEILFFLYLKKLIVKLIKRNGAKVR